MVDLNGVAVQSLPPARRRRPASVLPGVAVVGAFVVAAIAQGASGGPAPGAQNALNVLVLAGVLGVLLVPASLWAFYRRGRSLLKAMELKNPSQRFVSVYSSRELRAAILQLGGRQVTSAPWLSADFPVFVDLGDRFELWGSSRGGPERMLAVPWSAVSDVSVTTVEYPAMSDRAVELEVVAGANRMRLALPLNKRALLLLVPLGDAEFASELATMRARAKNASA